MAIPKSKWVWYGYAGHLVVSTRCAYHLTTRIGNFLVSTVGHYIPRGQDNMESIGAGKHDYFETMVFNCLGEDKVGNPIINGSELSCIRYKTSNLAELGHRHQCDKVAKEQ